MSSRRSSNLASPNNERVRKLGERLHSIQSSLDSERANRLELLDSKFTALEAQMEEFTQQTAQKLNDIRESVVTIQRELELDSVGREDELELRVKDLEELENGLHVAVEEELDLRRNADLRTFRVLEERTSAIRLEIAKEAKAKTDNVNMLSATLSSALSKTQESSKAALSDFASFHSSLLASLENEGKAVFNDLASERQSREDTEEAMLAMLKDVVGRIKTDLEQERRDREVTEENLLTLLEEACAKLNAITQGS